MLKVDPNERLKISEIIENKWLKDNSLVSSEQLNSIGRIKRNQKSFELDSLDFDKQLEQMRSEDPGNSKPVIDTPNSSADESSSEEPKKVDSQKLNKVKLDQDEVDNDDIQTQNPTILTMNVKFSMH